jgi:hypothetical protein
MHDGTVPCRLRARESRTGDQALGCLVRCARRSDARQSTRHAAATGRLLLKAVDGRVRQLLAVADGCRDSLDRHAQLLGKPGSGDDGAAA